MATVAERQAERERRRREAEERKKQKELAKQPEPDQVTVVGEDPNFRLGGGTFSILGIAENQALGGAQVISDQVQFKNANDQRQFGGVVNQVVGGQPGQQNNQQPGQQNNNQQAGQQNNQQAGQQNNQQAGQQNNQQAGQQPGPDQVTVVGEDPNFQLGGGTFSILGIAENRALDGAQVISDQVNFKNANDQRQFGGVVNQVVGGQPGQQNNQQAGQQPAGPNGQPNGQQAGAAGAQPGQDGQQPGQGKPAAEGNEPPDLLKLADEDDIEVEVNVDAKGGKSRHRDFVNFLATDKVPDSIFGVPVVQDESQYTEKDIEFFKRNPKAAGFYDLGDDEEEPEPPPDDGGGGGGPSADLKGGISDVVDKLKKRIGETGEVLDYGISWMERQAKQTADMDVPVLSKVADAVVQPALVGTRAAVANVTSGGGQYYQPEIRDERYFSEATLRELGESVKGMHGRTAGRADGMDNAAQFNLTQTLGGFTIKDGAVTDKFDINKNYHGVPDWMTKTARVVLGAEEDPDRGKVKTRIPLKALRLDAKGGEAEEFMTRNPSLFSHVKSFEKMREKPYEDVGGYAIGYGAHTDKDGKPVTRDTAAIDEATATSMLARDLYVRREALAKSIPSWALIPGNARQALLDVSMGRNDVLSKEQSPGLHADLTAAGKDAAKLLDAVKKHYYSYRTSANPEDQAGLEARRVAGGRLFFGEDFSYDGKTWDPKLGFVKKYRSTRQAAKGGDSAGKDDLPDPPEGSSISSSAPAGGPRIVINPKVFEDKRDALCVAFNEAFRIVMEDNGFEPVSEPTDRQRRFFADTAYADDEVQLRRTILARIATLDTSVSDPTDEQLQETAEMLEMVMEVGAPQNEWERRCVKRLLDVISASLNGTENPGTPIDKEPPDVV